MRLFGGNRMDSISNMMQKTGLEDDMPIQASMVSKSIESAQRQVESMHFAARKSVLEYDDVMNLQRKAIYEERNAILDGKDTTESISKIIEDSVADQVAENLAGDSADEWDKRALELYAANMTGREDFKVDDIDHDEDPEAVSEALYDFIYGIYESKASILGDEVTKNLANQILLRVIDTRWMAHLSEMDYLRYGIGLRALGQRDPLVEYKNEAYLAFQNLTATMYDDFLRTFLRLEINIRIEQPEPQPERKMQFSAPESALENTSVRSAVSSGHAAAGQQVAAAGAAAAGAAPKPAQQKAATFVKDKDDPFANVGRNDPCPCGSGLKYKKCHGK